MWILPVWPRHALTRPPLLQLPSSDCTDARMAQLTCHGHGYGQGLEALAPPS